jgi:5-methylcytosine-specific restriction endonuclease McrA
MRSYQVNSRIRELARLAYKRSDKPKQCVVCGYQLHYEICHVIPISDFSIDTSISVVNALSNLIALCPNHHWELDNGYLTLDYLKDLL